MKMRRWLVSAACCAIWMRSRDTDCKKAVKLLKEDLTNGPNHCFGIHDKCSPDFCSTAQGRLSQSSASVDDNTDTVMEVDSGDGDDILGRLLSRPVLCVCVCVLYNKT